MLNVGIVKKLDDNPSGGAELEPEQNKNDDDILNFDRDKPLPFELSEFIKHVDKVQGRKPNSRDNLSLTDRKSINSILKKIKILKSNPQLNFIMDELNGNSPSLEIVLSQFVGENEEKNLRIIDISGLPNETAGPLTALIARLLFQYKLWQTKDERKTDPILFVCEEANS